MNKRFINDDYKLKHGGRKAVRITQEELQNKILSFTEEPSEESDIYEIESAVGDLLEENATIYKDIGKILVSTENYTITDTFGKVNEGISMHGFGTLENGLTYLGVYIGGDWEYPVFLIIYWDGKKLRAYIPTYGNCFNTDYKCAFGSEDNQDDINESKIFEKYKKLGIDTDEYTEEMTGKAQMYCLKYGLHYDDDIGFNFNAIKEDILARIEVV